MQKKHFFILAITSASLAIVLVGVFIWTLYGVGEGIARRPHFEHSSLEVIRADGVYYSFAVEVATTSEEQSYGLMFQRNMPKNTGMIFPYMPPREIAFWMKNTLIPLDMIFVKPDGTIARIVSEAKPEDVTPISSQEPVSAVIEVNGGIAKQDGFAIGDKIISPILPTTM